MYNRNQQIDSRAIFALSADIAPFKYERILTSEWAQKFPGAEWMSIFADILRNKNYIVTTVDVALSHVKEGFWEASDIHIIQHLDDVESETLIEMGAKPVAITSFESPLYVPNFFNEGGRISSKFTYRILFSGLFNKGLISKKGNFQLRFPIYHKEDIRAIVPWSDREFMVAVVANKYALPFSKLYLQNPVDALKLFKRIIISLIKNKSFYLSHNVSDSDQLQDQRYSAFYYFGKMSRLKLYGKGWESLRNLPSKYRKQISSVYSKLLPEICDSKLEKISQYKYSLCFENCSYPGYVTEKIIECFVAGVIPVYLGAPDIEKFVPAGSFIDIRKFNDWNDLLEKLDSIQEDEAIKIINEGQQFLTSEQGQLHSFRGFANFLSSLVLNENIQDEAVGKL